MDKRRIGEVSRCEVCKGTGLVPVEGLDLAGCCCCLGRGEYSYRPLCGMPDCLREARCNGCLNCDAHCLCPDGVRVGACPGCGAVGFGPSTLGPGRCQFCDGTEGGQSPNGPE